MFSNSSQLQTLPRERDMCKQTGKPKVHQDVLSFKFQTPFKLARFGIFRAMTMKDAVFCDVAPCGSRKN
jgi:hypothetical protein